MKHNSLLARLVLVVLASFSLNASVLTAEPAVVTNSLGMKLVRIEPGSFEMGQAGPPSDYHLMKHSDKFDDADWDERPVHKVSITSPFQISATEVTFGQYRKFKPDHLNGRGGDDEAARNVSWHDAVEFCKWLSAKEGKPYRLPTEAEWEYACRAGTTTLFNTGDTLPAGTNKWFGNIGFRERYFPDKKYPPEYDVVDESKIVLPVGRSQPNAWGLFDMHGNVAEWCSDWYGPYETDAQSDPVGRADGDFRVIRSGAHTTFTRFLRSANRAGWIPEATNETTGFRVVVGELPATQPLPLPEPPLNARDVAQTIPKLQRADPSIPVFAGPKPFVKIPPDSYGPLFSGHNHSPAITECPNGDLLAVWYSCVEEPGLELSNVASRLRHGSAEWESASPFWDGADVNDHAPKLWWDGEQTIFFLTRGFTENVIRESTDNGATWTKARRMFPHGEFGNQLIRTKEGVFVITQDNRTTPFNLSRDGGKTWTYPGQNEPGSRAKQRYPGIHAPVVQLNDGRLMTFSRLNTPEEQKPYDFLTPAGFTSDWGETWTMEKTPFPAISSVQRAVLIRLNEGPLLLCSFTDQRANWKQRKGMPFKSNDGSEFTGYGLFAAVSFDDGKTWPTRRLLTPGGKKRSLPSIDHSQFELSDTLAESGGYLAACQTRDGNVQLISSKNHYTFNLAWLKDLPPPPKD